MESMKAYKADEFDAWRAKHVRVGDGEKFRAIFDKIHGAPKKRGRPRKKVEDEPSADE